MQLLLIMEHFSAGVTLQEVKGLARVIQVFTGGQMDGW